MVFAMGNLYEMGNIYLLRHQLLWELMEDSKKFVLPSFFGKNHQRTCRNNFKHIKIAWNDLKTCYGAPLATLMVIIPYFGGLARE